jgi:hypothetical protein
VTLQQSNSTDFKDAILKTIASILRELNGNLFMASYKVQKGKKTDSKQRKLIDVMVLGANTTGVTPNVTATYTVSIQSDLTPQYIVTTLNNAVDDGNFAVVLSSHWGTTVTSIRGAYNTQSSVNPAEISSTKQSKKSGKITVFLRLHFSCHSIFGRSFLGNRWNNDSEEDFLSSLQMIYRLK